LQICQFHADSKFFLGRNVPDLISFIVVGTYVNTVENLEEIDAKYVTEF